MVVVHNHLVWSLISFYYRPLTAVFPYKEMDHIKRISSKHYGHWGRCSDVTYKDCKLCNKWRQVNVLFTLRESEHECESDIPLKRNTKNLTKQISGCFCEVNVDVEFSYKMWKCSSAVTVSPFWQKIFQFFSQTQQNQTSNNSLPSP